MSRYEELSKLACEQSASLHAHRQECDRFAFELIRGMYRFLGCPPEAMLHVRLDGSLGFAEVKSPVAYSVAEGTPGTECFHYYGFQIDFRSPDSRAFMLVNTRFGLRKQGDRFCLRLDADEPIDPGDDAARTALYDQLCRSMEESFREPALAPKREFGFRPPAKAAGQA